MSRLLSADFAKLWKNIFFRLCMIGMFLFGIYMKVMDYVSSTQYGFTASLSSMLTIYIFVLVFMIPAFVSLFVGTEYSDGTIRNKLIIGHTRLSIYLSNLITGVAAALIFTAAYLIAGLAVGIPLCGVTGVNYRELVTLLLLSIVTMTATVSLSTLVGMLCQNRAVTAVANILAILFLLVMSIYISARLNEPEYYQSVTALADDGTITEIAEEKNPSYLRGTERKVYEFLDEFIPTSQAVSITRGSVNDYSAVARMAGYSAVIIIVSTAVGIFVFRKKDLK